MSAEIPDEALDPAHEAFLEEAVSTGVVWGVKGSDGWAVVPAAEDPAVQVMPFWSAADGASRCCTGEWEAFSAEAVPLEGFMEAWLPGLAGDGLRVGVNWDHDLVGVELPPLELQADLETCIQDRFGDQV